MNKKLVIVVGLSGSGKTGVMHALENMGYYCMDNVFYHMFESMVETIYQDPQLSHVALSITATRKHEDLLNAITYLKGVDWLDITMLFIDASTDVIIRRYKQTRRPHPFRNVAHSLTEAIELERLALQQVRMICEHVFDTTHTTTKQIATLVEATFVKQQKVTSMSITFISFGYKNGLPRDIDLAIDVRFLKNPYYVEELRPLTGNQIEVYSYVMEDQDTQIFTEKSISYLDYLFACYKKEGKSHIIIGIGCTGGQHRSVSLVNYFAKTFQNQYSTYVFHRDAIDAGKVTV